jgi:hypothetical protein
MKPHLFLIVLILLLAGCRQSAQPTPTPDASASPEPDIRIDMAVEPSPPTVGEATLVVRMHSPAGEPIAGAHIRVRGDMNHAGMRPVLAEAVEAEAGVYQVPFEWTMGGEWIVTLDVTLDDGRRFSRAFTMSVTT